MFFAAPVGNGQPLRAVPVSTVLLVVLNIAMAAWLLPTATRVYDARARAELELSPPASTGSETGSANTSARLEQIRQDALAARLRALDAADPFQRWGYQAGGGLFRVWSALFLHANLLHLLANLFLLVLVGIHLEQSWGPLRVLGLYLVAGSVALYADAAWGPPEILAGSSASAAALLGAYSVRFRKLPLRCLYVFMDYWRPRTGMFQVPCIVLPAVWLLHQLSGTYFAVQAGDTGIAFLSHLMGFLLGGLAALFPRTREA